MNCAQTRNLLHAFLDGALDLVRHLEIEHHLAECSPCAAEHAGLCSLSAALKADGLYFRASPDLLGRVRASLRRSAAPETVRVRRSIPWRRVAVGVSVAAGVALLFGALTLLVWNRSRPEVSVDEQLARALVDSQLRSRQAEHLTNLEREVVASHIRSLQAEHLTDKLSSDRHTVKPWFKGRVDFSPLVFDLSGEGYPLVGGRLDYLDNRAVAALVYRRRLHVINVFLWPAVEPPNCDLTMAAHHGYHVVHWTAGGMTWSAVSDLNPGELREFADMVVKEAGKAHP